MKSICIYFAIPNAKYSNARVGTSYERSDLDVDTKSLTNTMRNLTPQSELRADAKSYPASYGAGILITMKFESEAYRKELADTLRVADKSERSDILRFAKSESEYVRASAVHRVESFDTLQTQDLEKIVTSSKTLEDLLQKLQDRVFLIHNSQKGRDHSEHFAKRIDLAITLGDPMIIPETGDLRHKVVSLLGQKGIELMGTGSPEAYKKYLSEKFRAHEFSEEELELIIQKLPPSIFGSIDVEMEGVAMEINALHSAKSKFSCAGHPEEIESEFDESSVYSGYFAFETSDPELVTKIKALVKRTPSFQIDVLEISSLGISIYFSNIVPDEWISENGLRTKDELFEESKRELSLILGTEILDFPIDKYKDSSDSFSYEIRRLQKNFIQNHPESATIPFSRNRDLLFPIAKCLPNELRWREYKDHYRSPEVRSARLTFIQLLVKTIKDHRQKITSAYTTSDSLGTDSEKPA